MGYNGSGVFSRLHSWISDAASAIAISSSRMDADTNDIADGLSNVICRDGQTTTTAAIPFAQGVTVSAGTVGAPSFSFTGNATTGFYQIAANEIGISVSGAKVGDISATGFAVTGTISSTGNISAGANLSAAGTLSVTGNQTNSGNLTVTGSITAGSIVGLTNVTNDAQTKAAIVPNTAPGAGQILAGNAGGTAYAPVSVSGDATLSSAGAITVTKTNGTAFGSAATLGVGSGLTSSGNKIIVDTNNAGGIGGYALMHNGTGGTLGNGATAAGNVLYPIGWNSTGTLVVSASSFDALQGTTSTWRYIGGWVMSAQDKGLFIRVS